MTDFKIPEYWNFPPFFTIQPVDETRRKQLDLWSQLILSYHAHSNIYRMIPSNYTLFSNENINRKLSQQAIRTVIDYLIKSGHAEWEDETQTTLAIFYKPPEVVAEDIYNWALGKGFIESILTIYELYSGEDHLELGLSTMDPGLIRKSLLALEKKGKCKMIYGSTADEDGVKFLAI